MMLMMSVNSIPTLYRGNTLRPIQFCSRTHTHTSALMHIPTHTLLIIPLQAFDNMYYKKVPFLSKPLSLTTNDSVCDHCLRYVHKLIWLKVINALYIHAGYWLVKNISDNVLVLSAVLSSSVATRSLKLTNNQPRWVVKKEGWVTYIYVRIILMKPGMTWEWKVSSEEGSSSIIV